MKWEYTIFVLEEIKEGYFSFEFVLDEHIDRMGQKGWELVTVDNGVFYFKRACGELNG